MNQNNLYFSEPLFLMNSFSRFLARLISHSFYAVLSAAAVFLLFSDVEKLFWAGFLILLFLGDRLLHFKEGEKAITGLKRFFPRMSRRGKKSDEKISINAADYLTPASFSIIEKAFDKAAFVGGDFYFYLAKSLVAVEEIKMTLLRMDVKAEDFENRMDALFGRGEPKKTKIFGKEDALKKAGDICESAFIAAFNGRNDFIEPHELFVALSAVPDEKLKRLFNFFGIETADLEKAVVFSHFSEKFGFLKKLPDILGAFAGHPRKFRHRAMNRAWTARPTPTLDKFSVDFTDLARRRMAGFLIGHKIEYERLVDILSREAKPNALLVGEAGSGKETIVAALAHGIIKDDVPEAIFDKRIVSLNIGSLISGGGTDEISKRLNKIAEEIILAGNIILYISDIHNLVKAGGQGGVSAADVFLPIINNDAFPVIGATYPREYKEFIETKSDFGDAFETIRVNEISEGETVELLAYESLILERRHKIMISFGAIKQSAVLAHKYFRNKLLPSGARDLLRESLAYASQKGNKIVSADDVVEVAERKINVPIHKAGEAEVERLLNLENIIHKNLIDQEQAVSAVSRALREYRSGLSRRGGPIASFLFVGPTGVGKTELSKILAKEQFGSESLMARFDMSEYQNKESVVRFIGSPDGRIAGGLTEAIIQKPYSLILLDEFEKAHSDILNLFLQVFDDGRLTDGLGRVVDFTNTIIIATSNAHSNFIKERIETGDGIEKISEELKKKLTEFFKPELLNRFSKIVVFKNLSPSDIEAIAELHLKSLAEALEETNGVSFDFDEAVIKYVAKLGFDPVFGARPLRAVISDKIRSVLAEKILRGEIIRGNSARAVLENGEIKFIEK